MNILHFRGGLGNQLFEYAFYYYWKKQGVKSIWLDATYPPMLRKYGFDMQNIFPEIGNDSHFLPWWKARPLFLIGDIFKKVFKINLTATEPTELPVKGKIWVRGFFQRFDYLQAIENDIRSLFCFTPFTESENIAIAQRIAESESVSIHIRRGNYVKPRQRIVYGDICTPEYYKEAIRRVKEQIKNPKFFVFSNDVKWVKQEFAFDNAEYITINTGKKSFRDMQLMSLCKHNIIANSSFSWWGAWLNKNPEKLVFAPAKWHHNHPDGHTDRLIPPSWTRIGKVKPFVTICLTKRPNDTELSWLMRQRYSDFEICFPEASDHDEKKIISSPTAIHHLDVPMKELRCFRDKKYLQKKLLRVL